MRSTSSSICAGSCDHQRRQSVVTTLDTPRVARTRSTRPADQPVVGSDADQHMAADARLPRRRRRHRRHRHVSGTALTSDFHLANPVNRGDAGRARGAAARLHGEPSSPFELRARRASATTIRWSAASPLRGWGAERAEPERVTATGEHAGAPAAPRADPRRHRERDHQSSPSPILGPALPDASSSSGAGGPVGGSARRPLGAALELQDRWREEARIPAGLCPPAHVAVTPRRRGIDRRAKIPGKTTRRLQAFMRWARTVDLLVGWTPRCRRRRRTRACSGTGRRCCPTGRRRSAWAGPGKPCGSARRCSRRW